MRLLIVNPNTTAAMTGTIAAAARAAAAPGTEIVAVTARQGPASIEGFYDEAFAVPGLIEAIADHRDGIDGVAIACFDDTGLDAARTASAVPVVGICEAALALAGPLCHRFGIVTTLPRSIAPLEHLARRYGMAERCRVRAADIPVLGLEAPGALDQLRAELRRALDEDRAELLVLGCAGMADLARSLSAELGVPVIDGVGAAVKLLEALVGLGLSTSRRGAYAAPLPKRYDGPLAGFAPR